MICSWTSKWKWKSLNRVWLFATPWNSPGQNTGVGSYSLLQGIFRTQGLNPGLLHCRQVLYQLGHKGSPRILEMVAYPFSSRSSQPRNWTKVSSIAGRFLTNCTVINNSYHRPIHATHIHLAPLGCGLTDTRTGQGDPCNTLPPLPHLSLRCGHLPISGQWAMSGNDFLSHLKISHRNCSCLCISQDSLRW